MMRYGVRLPNSGPFASGEGIFKMATTAERLGFDAVMTHDHVNWGYEDRTHFYAGSVEAAEALGWPADFYEVMTTLSYVAAITQRVKLVPDSLCLAWRPVVLFARQILTLHQLSRGRFVLCVGVGNVRKDYEVTGTSWEERQRIALEKLKVLRMLIDQASPLSFQGEYVSFKDAELTPRPAGLPLWYAGMGNLAVKRAARYCEGWMPAASPEYIKRRLSEIHELAQQAGRSVAKFDVITSAYVCVAPTDEEAQKIAQRTLEAHMGGEWVGRYDKLSAQVIRPFVGSPETVAAIVRDHKEAGVNMLRLGFIGHSMESLLEQMEVFIREVKPLVG